MRTFSILFITLFGTLASAQSLPERYMVTGVASDDTLNIRAEPIAMSDIIGEFGPYTLNVEILRVLDGWGYTGAGERSGWVSMRYLTSNQWPSGEVPRPLNCFGTEPFWNFTMSPRGVEFNALARDGGPRAQTIIYEDVSLNGFMVQTQEGPSLTRTLLVSALSCSDGMSDRQFSMSATMFTSEPEGNTTLTGCCTMQVN